MSARQAEFGESDDEARYANLRAHVKELGYDALDQMAKSKSIAELRVRSIETLGASLVNFRQLRQEDEQRNEQEDAGDYEIRGLHHVSFGHSISQQLCRVHGRQFRRSVLDAGQDESGTNKCDEHGARGVEGLGQIQSSFRAFRRS